ncbi:MAG: hypothetical protein J6B98_03720 [Bacilli bacterium]|nr:hypothetical protein [Bacilli bacterium]
MTEENQIDSLTKINLSAINGDSCVNKTDIVISLNIKKENNIKKKRKFIIIILVIFLAIGIVFYCILFNNKSKEKNSDIIKIIDKVTYVVKTQHENGRHPYLQIINNSEYEIVEFILEYEPKRSLSTKDFKYLLEDYMGYYSQAVDRDFDRSRVKMLSGFESDTYSLKPGKRTLEKLNFSFFVDDDGFFCDPDHGYGCTLSLCDYEYYDYFELNKMYISYVENDKVISAKYDVKNRNVIGDLKINSYQMKKNHIIESLISPLKIYKMDKIERKSEHDGPNGEYITYEYKIYDISLYEVKKYVEETIGKIHDLQGVVTDSEFPYKVHTSDFYGNHDIVVSYDGESIQCDEKHSCKIINGTMNISIVYHTMTT